MVQPGGRLFWDFLNIISWQIPWNKSCIALSEVQGRVMTKTHPSPHTAASPSLRRLWGSWGLDTETNSRLTGSVQHGDVTKILWDPKGQTETTASRVVGTILDRDDFWSSGHLLISQLLIPEWFIPGSCTACRYCSRGFLPVIVSGQWLYYVVHVPSSSFMVSNRMVHS